MRLILLFLTCLILIDAQAQLKPGYFPEEIPQVTGPITCTLCKPGIRNKSRSKGLEIGYGFTPYSTFKPEDNFLGSPPPSFNNLAYLFADLKVPLIRRDRFNFLVTYKFYTEKYNIADVGQSYAPAFQGLDSDYLKSNSLGFIISAPLDETKYIAVVGKYTNSGNYPGWISFDHNSAIYKFRAFLGFKKTDDLEWGVGVNISQSFRRFTFLPFVVFNKNFNDRWGFESVLPAVAFLRYNLNEKNILLFGPQYSSRSYRFTSPDDIAAPFDYALNESKILTSLRLEHEFIPWIWGNFQAGYQINFATDFESKNTLPTFQADPTDAPYFQISIFVSPPRN